MQLLAEGYVDDTVYRAGEGKEISLNVDDFFGPNEVATATVGCEDRNSLIVVTVVDVGSRQQVARKLVDDVGSSGAATVSLGKFREGTYRVRAQGADGGSANDVFLVMDSESPRQATSRFETSFSFTRTFSRFTARTYLTMLGCRRLRACCSRRKS